MVATIGLRAKIEVCQVLLLRYRQTRSALPGCRTYEITGDYADCVFAAARFQAFHSGHILRPPPGKSAAKLVVLKRRCRLREPAVAAAGASLRVKPQRPDLVATAITRLQGRMSASRLRIAHVH